MGYRSIATAVTICAVLAAPAGINVKRALAGSAPTLQASPNPAAGNSAATTVIPPAAPETQQGAAAAPVVLAPGSADPDPTVNPGNAAEYQANQNAPAIPMADPRLYSLQDFIGEGGESSPIGLELREDRSKINGAGEISGLAIVNVRKGSPAAKAGLKGYQGTAHALLDGATVAAALFFPPAIVAVSIIDQSRVGESYDLIMAVDGKRVHNVLDFEDAMRDARPGDSVYLTIVRHGHRMQVKVDIPQDSASSK